MHWPLTQRRFGLSMLVEISGVDAATIKRWQHRGTMKFPRVGSGTDRTYTIKDALHLAIVAEMAGLGLTITGNGADLADALAGYASYRLQDDPRIARLKAVALVPVPGEGDWVLEPRLERAVEAGSYTVIGLSRIVEEVVRRYSVGSL